MVAPQATKKIPKIKDLDLRSFEICYNFCNVKCNFVPCWIDLQLFICITKLYRIYAIYNFKNWIIKSIQSRNLKVCFEKTYIIHLNP
jgi:hypothetical protein